MGLRFLIPANCCFVDKKQMFVEICIAKIRLLIIVNNICLRLITFDCYTTKIIKLMYRDNAYYAPNIEIIEVKVEQGFQDSIVLPEEKFDW